MDNAPFANQTALIGDNKLGSPEKRNAAPTGPRSGAGSVLSQSIADGKYHDAGNETSRENLIRHAADWLLKADLKNRKRRIVVLLKQRFGLSGSEAVKAIIIKQGLERPGK